ncbi:unnamed protein product [Hyaloperonospora brassicae]|uniref:C2H2-type domain-containing protein n=1 Tax=Hyaloperonospora brassicae TaxID=162125 RepID=A0AAV0UHH8_HYABA|nr:unnamed protein product [Hyaloperonospora brassicae]
MTCWPLEVYDYGAKAITDEAVGGIDLHGGGWIHCKWCNTTLKTTSFSLGSWTTHKKTKTHVICGQKTVGRDLLQPQVISCSSQSSAHSSMSSTMDTRKLVSGSHLLLDQDSLLLVRRHLYKNKQHQWRLERDVNHVINAMTSLVTDQQSDLTTLRDKMNDMAQEIQRLRNDLETLRRKRRQQPAPPLQHNVRARPTEIAAPTSYVTPRRLSASYGRVSHAIKHEPRTRQTVPTSNSKRSKRMAMMGSLSDMDDFEKRFQLKGRW